MYIKTLDKQKRNNLESFVELRRWWTLARRLSFSRFSLLYTSLFFYSL